VQVAMSVPVGDQEMLLILGAIWGAVATLNLEGSVWAMRLARGRDVEAMMER